MAAGDEVDARFLRCVLRRLVGLPGQKAVVACRRRLGNILGRATGANGHAFDELRPVREDEWHATEALLDALGEIADRNRVEEPPAEPEAVGEAALALDLELVAEERVVPDLRVCVEGEVVGDEAQVGVEEGAQPLPQHRPDPPGILVPEEPVMHQHHLRIAARGALEELARGRDSADDLPDLRCPDDLEPHRAVVRIGGQVEVLVGPGNDLVSVCHRATNVTIRAV